MKHFHHIDARSVEEASQWLNDGRGKTKVIAGGTDLLGVLKDRILPVYPEVVVNLKTIPGLDAIESTADGLTIGALTRLSDIAESPLVKEKCKALADAAAAVASPQIRNLATIGGNLCQEVRCGYYRYPNQLGGRIICHRKGSGPCHAVKGDNRYSAVMGAGACVAVCPSDVAVALTALDGSLEIMGVRGKRTVKSTDFFTRQGTSLKPDEIVTMIRVPFPSKEAEQHFYKFTLRSPIDFALTSISSILTLKNGVFSEARIALGAVAPVPVRARRVEVFLINKTPDETVAEQGALIAVQDARPLTGNAYKVQITRTLIKRAILNTLQEET